MRKLLLLTLAAAVSFQAAAQSWDQAYLFSENNYGGTARSIGMGNALTAVGGDPGSLTLNPAGSSVAGYSQFFITPALSITATRSAGYVPEGALDPIGMGDAVFSGYTRMKVHNLGFIISMDTGRRHGFKRMSVGFVVNSTGDFTGRINAAGVNYNNDSYSGSLASLAQGYATSELGATDWFAEGPSWESMLGFRTGMFDYDNVAGKYVGVSDVPGTRGPDAALYQKYGLQTKGYKQDVLLNMSANFSDQFYIGANLGIVTLSYGASQIWEEMPENAQTFPAVKYEDGTTARFQSLSMRQMYNVTGNGMYFKAGFIWRPFAGLRIGGAIQTPTVLNMKGRCQWSGETNLQGQYFPAKSTPEDSWLYALVTPFRWNVGLAYAFGKFAVLSADYEWVDYKFAHFGGRSVNSDLISEGTYSDENADIVDALGIAHHVRAGLEFKPAENFAVRVGYNYTSGAQKSWVDYYFDKAGDVVVGVTPLTQSEIKAQDRHTVSFGLGYSIGSFFTDFAVRMRFYPDGYYTPYYHYQSGKTHTLKLPDYSKETPVVRVSETGIDTVLTLGWRF